MSEPYHKRGTTQAFNNSQAIAGRQSSLCFFFNYSKHCFSCLCYLPVIYLFGRTIVIEHNSQVYMYSSMHAPQAMVQHLLFPQGFSHAAYVVGKYIQWRGAWKWSSFHCILIWKLAGSVSVLPRTIAAWWITASGVFQAGSWSVNTGMLPELDPNHEGATPGDGHSFGIHERIGIAWLLSARAPASCGTWCVSVSYLGSIPDVVGAI